MRFLASPFRFTVIIKGGREERKGRKFQIEGSEEQRRDKESGGVKVKRVGSCAGREVSDEELREAAKEGKVGRNVTEKLREVRRRRVCKREKGVEIE